MPTGPNQLLLANLDFEYELASTGRYQSPSVLAKVSRRWRSVLRLLPGYDQAEILDLQDLEESLASRALQDKFDQLRVWGVTPRSTRLAETLGFDGHFPSADLVRKVNDKRFSHNLERTLKIALPCSQVIDSMKDLESVLQLCSSDWVVKHPFGVSGREEGGGQSWRDDGFSSGLGSASVPKGMVSGV